MHLAQAENWLDGLVNAERLPSFATARLSLAPIRALTDRIGNPQRGLPALHIAGSKGKGSTALLCEALLCELGQRAGVFTSPHLLHWSERFRIAGKPVADTRLAAVLSKLRPVVEGLLEGDDAPSFFDATTAAAFLLFAEAQVDCAVIEVGLGGRLDSTNICEPAVTCVTSIELEHTERLGNTRAKIAAEKAGIAKPGAPLVVGALSKDALEVVEARALAAGAPLLRQGFEFQVQLEDTGIEGSRFRYRCDGLDARFQLKAPGAHQVGNAALALSCVRQLGLATDAQLVAAGQRAFARLTLPGRIEILGRAPWIVVDSAHTKASARALAAVLAKIPRGHAHLLLSVSSGKNLDALCAELAPHADEVTATRANTERSLPPQRLAAAFERVARDLPVKLEPDPRLALKSARERAKPGDLLCVSGSVYLAGIARQVLGAG